MEIISNSPVESEFYPDGLRKVEYESSVDGFYDWALLYPAENTDLWIVVIHGHGSNGDQLFTRQDVREAWLPVFLNSGASILSVNLRGNAWMGPDAAVDMHELIEYLREEYGLKKTIFCSGSMGGTSNLIFAELHPESVNGIVTRGAATDLASYYAWCKQQEQPIIQEIADAIESSYGGTPEEATELYLKHSTLYNAGKLNMPVYFAHGGADQIIPVEQARALAAKLKDKKDFFYNEIPGGAHDSPLYEREGFYKIINMLK
jgi:pimeloyl-ACP methyl ester carboxylesterase